MTDDEYIADMKLRAHEAIEDAWEAVREADAWLEIAEWRRPRAIPDAEPSSTDA